MNGKTILVWFRNDLRVHDNEILLEAVKRADSVIPVYCFDPRYFSPTNFGTNKTGPYRAKFLLESVAGLRKSLQALGGDLMIKVGMPEDVLPQICSQYAVSEVYHHREVASEETTISSNVEAALWKLQINLKHFIGHTLYHKEDLPFPIRDIPDAFAVFRKKLERDSDVRPVFATPQAVNIPKGMETRDLPSLVDLGMTEITADERAKHRFVGGEEEGLFRLQTFLKSPAVPGKGHKNINSISSLFSPWLSLGCLSPREVYWQVKNSDKEHPNTDLAASIILELQWRDYFRFMLKKHGSSTTNNTEDFDVNQLEAFNRWKHGNTGVAVIDACMNELNFTGFINHKCRQYVAMYLVKDLKVSWHAGAAYFEEMLIDYSPASNWGNWTYIASDGVMSVNKPISLKTDTTLEEPYIRKWLAKIREVD